MSRIRRTYTVLRYEVDNVVVKDSILREDGIDHDAKLATKLDELFVLYPDAVVETATVYMNEEVYVDMTAEPVVEGE